MTDQRRGPFLTDDMEKVEGKMKVRLHWGEEVLGTVSFEHKVCPTCRGTSTVVDPSVDEHGIDPAQFERDPKFAEDYFGGTFDKQCPHCEGENVVPELSPSGLTPSGEEEEEIVEEFLRRQRKVTRSREIQRQERRMAMGRGMR